MRPNGPNPFTAQDLGCYADGCLGHDHIRATLAYLLETLSRDLILCSTSGLLLSDSLLREMPDDASDEAEALELLNEDTVEGISWLLLDGDLVLIADSEVQS